ncbi:TRAP transporter substrate-binding protein [Vibrio cincinnatiensis]|uniref:TRAP transporter substrate-binding protein n=1 Tax=Vibrio cincinnatiensis TaxID=675 RepID=UPI001EDFBFC0|nr:TRAP transporter substrate-binding protein [Vibrio cincinnatiensis]MCG3726158.1 TRAP transporter substrate-binding protein [Vibrio cincinnatiensis]
MKLIRFLLLIAAYITTLPIALATELKLGHVTPPSHIWHKVAQRFDNNLRTASEHAFSIQIYPLSKLGGDDQMVDLLQSGAIQLGVITAGSLSNRSPSMNAWFLPYLFDNIEQAAAMSRTQEAKHILDELEKHKLIGLGYTFAGMRHLITTAPVNDITHLKDQKIRSFPNPLFNLWWRALKAAPTALSVSDVMPALTTNLLNGVDADLDIVVGLKMYQQAPYLTLTNHMTFPGVVVASQVWWESLSLSQQNMIRAAYDEAEAWGANHQAQQEKENVEKLKAAGITISQLNHQELQKTAQPIAKEFAERHPLMLAFYQRVTKP